jgi:hypothetical protein
VALKVGGAAIGVTCLVGVVFAFDGKGNTGQLISALALPGCLLLAAIAISFGYR